MKRVGALALAGAALWLVSAIPAGAADHGLVSESSGCGYPRFYTPRTGTSGALPDSHPVRGPAGTLFGRTIGAIKSQLVWWDVPMSDGARVRVHRRLLPALAEVEANLAAAAAEGLWYPIRSSETYGFLARTSIAHDGISYHGLGAAIDFNASDNPYRRDGRLITDMPEWFVDAWEEAGFCWGGHWRGVKDPMHFSWMGPAASPSYDEIPKPFAAHTSPAGFDLVAGRHDVVFGSTPNPTFVTEASGDGAPDVAHLRPWDEHAVLELATSRGGYAACGVWRWWIQDPPGGEPHLADISGASRPDLVFLDLGGGTVDMERYAVAAGYTYAGRISTAVPTGLGSRYLFGDANGDGKDDLWVVKNVGGDLSIVVWSAADGFQRISDSGVVPDVTLNEDTRLAIGDRTVDGRDDLLVIEGAGEGSTVTVVSARSLGEVAEVTSGPVIDAGTQLGFEDYDGDARPDLVTLSAGTLEARLGNTPLPGVAASSWFLTPDFECPDDTVPYHHRGRFADDDDSEFEADIEWLAVTGITRGCNPPFEDRFCPDQPVTRGQMAAFLVRALKLEPGDVGFVDVGGSVFAADIAALAEAGITKGCDPPANQRFCPDEPVTRGQMAAFLARGLALAEAPHGFTDIGDSVFENDIAALAAAGITRGCNPPAGDRFCPEQPVTRGQMAAFLHRAAGLFGS